MDNRLRPEIQRHIAESTIQLGDKSFCNAFNDFIVAEYPWITNHILWNQVGDVLEYNLDTSNPETLRAFILSTRLARYHNIAMVYSVFDECLLMSLGFFLHNENLLTGQAFHQCYFVGLEYINDIPHLIHKDFVEYEWSNGFWLRGRKPTQ